MAANAFLDSNILLYAVGDDDVRRRIAESLIAQNPVVSAQVIAAALAAGCTVLYSEDMQHGQLIDGTLMVVNPFTA
jgi:predicted nucleic acid-binding protein